MASIQDIRAALAEHARLALSDNRTSPSVYAYYPRTMNEARLPVVYVGIGRATYDVAGRGSEEFLETRVYPVSVIAGRGTIGADGEAERLIGEYLERLQDYFAARVVIEVDDGGEAVDARTIGDDGIQTFSFGTQDNPAVYVGFVFNIEVVSERTIAQVEE